MNTSYYLPRCAVPTCHTVAPNMTGYYRGGYVSAEALCKTHKEWLQVDQGCTAQSYAVANCSRCGATQLFPIHSLPKTPARYWLCSCCDIRALVVTLPPRKDVKYHDGHTDLKDFPGYKPCRLPTVDEKDAAMALILLQQKV